MNQINIVCLVEGEGEEQAVPILIRRLVQEMRPDFYGVILPQTYRVKRDKFVKPGELEQAVETAALTIERPGAILILLDADDDCPATLAPHLLQRAQSVRSDMPIAVVLAMKEYEAWFLAAAVFAGQAEFAAEPDAAPNPEAIRDAKGWLQDRMPRGSKYRETVGQLELTRHFDLTAARTTPSFDKLYRDIARLLAELELFADAP